MDSEVVALIKGYKDALLAKADYVTENLARSWLAVENRLKAEMSNLAYIIEAKRAAGELIDQQLLFDMDSYKSLIRNVEKELAYYGKEVTAQVIQADIDAGVLGVACANDAITAEFYSIGGSAPFWTKLNRDAIEAMYAMTNYGSPLRDILDKDFGLAAEGITDALLEGTMRGLGAVKVAENMAEGFSIGLDRATLIAQTEMSRAYREGTIYQYRTSGVVGGYYRLVKKETACLACLVLDGERYELAEDMVDHPGGYCDVIAKVKGVDLPEWEKGTDWFFNQSPEKQIELMGETRWKMMRGGIPLDEFVTKTHDPIWGDAPALRTLGSMRQAGYKIPTSGGPKPRPPKIPFAGGDPRGPELDKQQLAKIQEDAFNILKHSDAYKNLLNNVSDQELRAKIIKDFYEAANAPGTTISVRSPNDVVSLILKDGRLKNQFETGSSRGLLDNYYREQAEQKGLGLPMGLTPTEHPIYGAINSAGRYSAKNYGDVEWVLDDKVRSRATMTIGDSLGEFNSRGMMGTPVLKPDLEAAGPWISEYEWQNVLSGNFGRFSYLETQIQGGVDIVRDVKEVKIYVESWNRYEVQNVPKMIQAQYPNLKITYWQTGSDYQASQLTEEEFYRICNIR